MQLEIGTIHHLFVSCKGYHSASLLYIVSAQLRQFFRQNGLKAHEGLGDHFKLLCHDVNL